MDDVIAGASARSGALPADVPNERRRFVRCGEVPAPALVDQSVRSAELQLLDAREALKEARRRVVQLEDALEGWRGLREQMARACAAGTKDDPLRLGHRSGRPGLSRHP